MVRPLVVDLTTTSAPAGLSLEGGCTTAADIQVLENAIRQLLLLTGKRFWIDCRRLDALSYQGQRALLWADSRARTGGVTLYWVGLADTLLAQLNESGLALLLHLLPLAPHQTPTDLLIAAQVPAVGMGRRQH